MQWRDLRGNLGATYRPLTLVTTDSLAGKAGTAPIKTGGEMRKTRVNTGFHAHAESVGRLRRLRKSRYSLNNPETWARRPWSRTSRAVPLWATVLLWRNCSSCRIGGCFRAGQSLYLLSHGASVADSSVPRAMVFSRTTVGTAATARWACSAWAGMVNSMKCPWFEELEMRLEEVERVGCGFEVQTLLRRQMSRTSRNRSKIVQ